MELLMGNEAIALGAMKAGVQVVSGYPGTPSTEVLETVAKRNPGNIYVEWSVNEKAALEVGAGAAYSGARTMVTMKQVGLNVASDPLMCVNYIGVKGGMVILVCDDPGPISSQTEQDTRHFAKYAKIPVFDPVNAVEAFEMIQTAFEYSEKYHTPVIFRSTTRVSHACASIEVGELPALTKPEGFIKDKKWVIFPRLSYQNKIKLEARESVLSKEFSSLSYNEVTGSGKIGIACGGVSYTYIKEQLNKTNETYKLFKVATPFPFPEELALSFLEGLEKVLVFEELDPVIEDALIYICGKHNIQVEIIGKRNGKVPNAGELSTLIAAQCISDLFGKDYTIKVVEDESRPALPMRPPVLCAGCPHRASFYAVKQAMKGKEAVFCGDIGCYTLGNAAPLDMVDTCLCMGAGITVAQGIERAQNGTTNFAFIGDSTFFASGMTGIVNAVYNMTDEVVIILDNSTTAMTGHQPHPGMGKTVMGDISPVVSIKKIVEAIGVSFVKEVNPLVLKQAVETVKEAAALTGVRVVIFKSPCIAVTKKKEKITVNHDICTGCKKCIRELGCPALSMKYGKIDVDASLCTGCGLCTQVCPFGALSKEAK